MLRKLICSFLFSSSLLSYSQSIQTEYADVLVTKYYSHANMYFSDFYGGQVGNFPVSIDPHLILGANTTNFVSLPTGSFVILEFKDNQIIDYPSQPDIFITEMGCNNERAEVYISANGKDFLRLGIVDDCDLNTLDLAAINYKGSVKFIKVVGLDINGNSPGFDLVNVKGLPNSNIETNAVTDSLSNLLAFGIYAKRNESSAGDEWILESENLHETELTLFGPDKNKVMLHYLAIEPNKVVIDASGLKKGVYILEIKSGDEVYSQKIAIG